MNGSILYDFCELMREYLYNDMLLMLIIVLLYMFNVVYFIFIKKKIWKSVRIIFLLIKYGFIKLFFKSLNFK